MSISKRKYPNRKSRRSVFIVSTFFIFFSLTLFADSVRTLTLYDAVDLTLKNNQELSRYANIVKSMKSNFAQKKKNFLPELNLSGSYMRSYYKIADDFGEYQNDNSRNLNLILSVNRTIFDGFLNFSEKKQAFSQFEESKSTYTRTEQNVIYQTIINYLDVVVSKELIRVGNENLNTQKLLLTRIKDFFRAGKKAAVDVHYQNAEIANSQYQLLNSEKGLKLAKVKLMEGIGLVSGLEFKVVDPVVGDPAKLLDLEIMGIIELAKKNRTDLIAAKLNIDAAKHGLTAARSRYFPKVSIYGDVSTGYSSQNDIYSFSDQLWNNNPSASVGISASIPIFDKGLTKNRVTQAKLVMENSRIDLIKVNNRIWSELIQAEANYRTSIRLIEVAVAKLEYSKAVFESMTERYNVNAATITEVSQARSQYLQSQYDQVDAKVNLFRQGITLLYQAGDTEKMLSLIR